ncbi:MAG TPA: pilus assembly protein PilO [Mariprofundaceae bacterium]|nr:pilus assembly protein PilO [Mariprofundaceae bacterium]
MNFDAFNLDVLKPLIPLPMIAKVLTLVAVVIGIFVVYFFMFLTPLHDAIEAEKVQVENQRVLLQRNERLASDIPKKKEEYKKLQTQLKIALNMLPKKSQIPDLLESVTWAGKDSGLLFTEFKPDTESVQSIYAEVPVTLAISGTFKQMLTFLKRVGEMSRIVDVKNLKLKLDKNQILNIEGQAVTYRFVEGKKKKKQKRRRARR